MSCPRHVFPVTQCCLSRNGFQQGNALFLEIFPEISITEHIGPTEPVRLAILPRLRERGSRRIGRAHAATAQRTTVVHPGVRLLVGCAKFMLCDRWRSAHGV